MFIFKDLDDTTRNFMLIEVAKDGLSHAGPWTARRLTERGRDEWPDLLRAAIRAGDTETLAANLRTQGRMKTTEMSHRKGVPYEKQMPDNAAELLAEGEFNRYYCRAICLRALEEGCMVQVYRGRFSDNPRPESDAWIGKYVDAKAMLEDLRSNSGGEPGMVLPSVNTGLSLRLI